MSDWEDDYDEEGVAIEKLVHKTTATNKQLVAKDGHGDGKVYADMKTRTWFGESREARGERSWEGTDFRSRRGQPDRGRSHGERRCENETSDRSRPLIFKVENLSIGRIIGRGGAKIRELEESSGGRIKITRGDYEGEVVIFGSSAAQQNAKEMIEDLVAGTPSLFSYGTYLSFFKMLNFTFK
ncbi:hypothetical protein CRENBAI_013699 [Crenichthys baileyi]|uniref:K Homology domain-containing protein n=1 Tax=Crenichthys baileyi TaxID=28760 RepID=A0AAV9R861_9TELE